jgi:hypothetical protein
MEDNILTEEELEALYSFLSLEWDELDVKSRESWENILIQLENKIDEQNEKNKDLRS